MDTMASLGISNTPVVAQGTPSASTEHDMVVGSQVDAGGGNPPSGGVPPSGGGGLQNGARSPGGPTSATSNLSQSQIATMQASSGNAQGANGITGLIEKLISVLQLKAQSQENTLVLEEAIWDFKNGLFLLF